LKVNPEGGRKVPIEGTPQIQKQTRGLKNMNTGTKMRL